MEGWIKLHRKLLDNPIITKDSDYLAVWIYLLLNTTHKEYDALFNGKRITLKTGQLITGRKSVSEKLKIDENKVQRILKTLENEHQIEQQSGNRNRLITIVSWNKYQQDEQQNEQQVNNNCTTDEQQMNTNKNDKNIKNDKKNKKRTFDDVFAENNFDKELETALRDFIEMRKTINKPMTTRALELLVRNLNKLTNLKAEQIAILNQSIERGWQTVYPLKENAEKSSPKKGYQNYEQREYIGLENLYVN